MDRIFRYRHSLPSSDHRRLHPLRTGRLRKQGHKGRLAYRDAHKGAGGRLSTTVHAQESARTERITEPDQGTDRPASNSWPSSSGNSRNSNSYDSNSYDSSSSRDYSDLNNDPDDFDNPDDYADNVWGDDFDGWDEAYAYWEGNY